MGGKCGMRIRYVLCASEEFGKLNMGFNIDGLRRVRALLCADDIVVLTVKKKEMREALKVITEYIFKCKCSFNRKKSQVVIHGEGSYRKKGNRDLRAMLGGGRIIAVDQHKYLGIEFHRRRNFRKYKQKILKKATGRSWLIRGVYKRVKNLPTIVLEKLWVTLIRHVLEHGADTRGGGAMGSNRNTTETDRGIYLRPPKKLK